MVCIVMACIVMACSTCSHTHPRYAAHAWACVCRWTPNPADAALVGTVVLGRVLAKTAALAALVYRNSAPFSMPRSACHKCVKC